MDIVSRSKNDRREHLFMNNNTTVPSKSTTVNEEFSLDGATLFGGANLYADFLHKIGLDKAFCRVVNL
jgi:hypothetical protein